MTVMAFGCFDLLHPGHLAYLKQAKKIAGKEKLVIVIGRDKIMRESGKKPLFNENERREIIGSLKFVDEAILGDLVDKLSAVKKYKPTKIILGYDQQAGWLLKNDVIKDDLLIEKELKKRGLNARVIRLKPFKKHKYKSTKIKLKAVRHHKTC
ncbi:FAD synthase [Candidatus Micrarchaeota archaeon]|nr:FAD synthase [Candidatus Micrarchaeota archaeon]